MKVPSKFDVEKAIFGILLLYVVDRVVFIASDTIVFPRFSVPQQKDVRNAKLCELVVILGGMGLILLKN